MAVVHQYYRREFDLAPRVVRDVAADQTRRHEQARAWLTTTVAMMHHHHVTEDDLMYPLLVGRAPAELLERMERQHQQVAAAVDAVERLLPAWEPRDRASVAALAGAFDALLPPLVAHLDDEEDEVMPIVAEHLTVEEYERQGTSGNGVLDPQTLMMAFGAMVEQATPHEAAVMLSHPPAHVQAAWHEHGRDDHRALMALVRGSLQPLPRVTRPPRAAAART